MQQSNLEKTKKNTKFFRPHLIPLMLILAILPLIAHLYDFNSNLAGFPWYPDDDRAADFFVYYKSFTFVFLSAIMAGITLYQLIKAKGKIKFSPLFLPLGGYALLSLLSSLLSKYQYFSFYGFLEHFETVWVLLGYALVTYYAFLMVRSVEDVKALINSLIIGSVIILLIGFSQMIGKDFFRTELGMNILIPPSKKELGTLDFAFPQGRVHLSLYNPNYVGSYIALLSPIFFLLLLNSKKILQYLFYGLVFALSILCLVFSESQAGIIGLFMDAVLLLIVFRKPLLKRWPITLFALLVFFALFFVIDSQTNHRFTGKLSNLFHSQPSDYALDSIQTNEDHMVILYKNEPFSMRFQYNENGSVQFMVYDKNGEPLNCQLGNDGATYTILDKPFRGIQMYAITLPVNNMIGFALTIDGRDWYFTNQSDGSYYYVTPYGKLTKLKKAEESSLFQNDGFASGRGYIWARTLPLLKDYIILGSGADTFTFVFPNEDYIGAYNGGYDNIIVSKPHNLYLQIGVQSGMLALFSFLTFYLMYAISSFRTYFKNPPDTYLSRVGIGIFVGSFGYMICGFANDSTVTVAPLYWVLTGLGIAINYMIRNTKKEIQR